MIYDLFVATALLFHTTFWPAVAASLFFHGMLVEGRANRGIRIEDSSHRNDMYSLHVLSFRMQQIDA